MRWFWIDRFTEFVSGKHAVAAKNVSLSEEAVDEYAPGWPYMPASLITEGMAQTGGLLVAQLSDFKERVVLAKISHSHFFDQAFPGDTLTLRADIINLQPNGAFVSGKIHRGYQLFCDLELMFAFLGPNDERFRNVQLFEPAAFCRMLRLLRLFDVGRYEDGRQIQVPEYMLAAEQAQLLTS